MDSGFIVMVAVRCARGICVAAINHLGKFQTFHISFSKHFECATMFIFGFVNYRCKARCVLSVGDKKLQFADLNHNHGINSNTTSNSSKPIETKRKSK